MTNENVDTLLTALYVKIDDGLETHRGMGRPPRLSDSELVTLAVAQALLGFHSETRWLRYANVHLVSMFPYLPQQCTAAAPLRASRSASPSASSPWPQPSGVTTRPASLSRGP